MSRPLWRRILSKAYRTFRPIKNERYYLNRLARSSRDVFFIQIGAHDGRTDDYLFDLIRAENWSGVLVEPVDYLFERLKQNYQGSPQLYFENKAVSSTTGTRKFYSLRKNSDGLPDWYDQLGSFDREVILKHKEFIPNIEDYIVSQEVACVSVKDLLKGRSDHVDLMLIDTEGSDFEILKSIDFTRTRPGLIIYEDKHLTPGDQVACVKLLNAARYEVSRVSAHNQIAVAK